MIRLLHYRAGVSIRVLVFCLVTAMVGGACAATDRPNVLFLLTDDQRHDTIHAWGNDQVRTPHIDRLVNNGVSFRNAYIMGATSPAVCSPSRACLFSGRTLWNTECQGLFGFEISARFKTLPQVFREAGYETFATGKNEPGQYGHFARSFSSGDAILFKGMTRSQYRLPLHDFAPDGDYSGEATIREGRHSAEVYADACIRFLATRDGASKPFFAYVAFQTPHDPLNVPAEFREMYQPGKLALLPPFLPRHPFDNGMLDVRDERLEPWPRTGERLRERLAAYYGELTHTDAQIGRILKALDDAGQRENTIIVFGSDNGLALGSHGLLGKQSLYDHSVRVPLVVAGPDIPRGEERRQLCYLYDIYPTLCGLAGVEVPDTVEFRSLTPVIRDRDAAFRQHLSFAFMSWQRSVRDDRYKLIEYCVNGARHSQLFDLQGDPSESDNLAGDEAHAGTLKRLRALLEAERITLNDGNTPHPFTDAMGKEFWETYYHKSL